ncbi:transporter substrate-binding domain-containing protein [Rhodobacterales bacterium HKCCE2091]|nr:transporter substrate-binding domain-containing protein [Rhodobacterales bacterium HKCCE2091]
MMARSRPGPLVPCLILAILLGLATAVAAQEPDRRTLTVPWTDSAGFSIVADDGGIHSFPVDLAQAIAAEAGFDVALVRHDTPTDVIAEMRDGRADMLASVARLPALEPGYVFVGPVAEIRFHLYVRADAPPGWTYDTFGGTRIAVLSGTAASNLDPPGSTELVGYTDHVSAFAALIAGQVDGVIVADARASQTLRSTGFDRLIRPTFPAVLTIETFVALNRDHADLAPAIEEAIATLDASGELSRLRARWLMIPPVPVPDVLTVGVTHFPPYQVVNEDGSFGGFAVEVLEGLAERLGVDLRYVEVTAQEWAVGPQVGTFDLVPARSINPDEQPFIDFSLPIQAIEYGAFAATDRAETDAPPTYGILASSPIRQRVSDALGVAPATVETAAEGVTALDAGEIDILIFPTVPFREHLARTDASDRFTRLADPVFQSELAVAMRPGLGELKERLDVVIPAFLGSLQYRDIVRRWLEPVPFWTEDRLRLLFAAAGAVAALGVVAFVVQNWRARRLAERLREETRSASDRLSAVLASTRHAIFGFDDTGRIAVINPSGRALLALPEGAEPGNWPDGAGFLDPMAETPLEPDADPLRRIARGETVDGGTYLFRASPGQKPRWVRVTTDRVTEDRTPLRSLVVIEDDHENHLTRQKLDRAQRLSSLGLLSGGLAHDFNNILASILYNAQLVRMKADAGGAKVLDRIIASVAQGNDLTRRLLGFARQSPQSPGAVDVADCVAQLAALARPAIGEALDLDLPEVEDGLFVYCDAGELENALLNLVLNARDAIAESEQGDRVAIQVRTYDWSDETAQTGGMRPVIEISVSDNGPGMPDDVRRRAADPFFTTRGEAGGTGLGLAMAEGLAERAGGHLSIYSELGQGTTVRLRLPRVAADGAAMEHRSPDEVLRGKGERVLLVEDQAGLREPMADLLRELGYVVETAETAAAARETLETALPFDLVLSDIVMPGGTSGVDLARMLRRNPGGPAVVLMTGFAEMSPEETEDLGVPILRKPVPVAELAHALRDALATRGDG